MTRGQAIAHGAQIRASVARGQTAAAIQQVTLNIGRARTQSYAAQALRSPSPSARSSRR
jgi:hypothetical protein